MARKRQGGAGIFKGDARIRHRNLLPVDPPAALAALQGLVYDWDLASDALTWGPNACEIFGVTPDSLPQTGSAFARQIEPGSGSAGRDAAFSGSDAAYDLRYALRFTPDHVAMIQETGHWQPDAHGRPRAARGLLRVDRMPKDQLPGALKTRSGLLARLSDDIAESLRFSHTVTLIIGAVDAADDPDAVETIARRIRPLMRRRDHFTILSPNRFALALTSCLSWEAMSAMKRLANLAALSMPQLHLGAACGPDHAFESPELLRLAEQALETAIAHGEAAVLHDARRHSALPDRSPPPDPFLIVDALNDRRVTVSLQPVIDARTGEAALMQAEPCLPASRGRVLPLRPLPALDEANLPLLVDGRALELAADHLARNPAARVALPISVATLRDAEWLPMLAAHLGARPGIESRLLIEVPEAILAEAGPTRGRLDAMKALGIGLILSGFGSGYASLAHLDHLCVDLLKIDGVFSQSLKRSTDDRLFVRRLIDIAHHFGIAAIADRVDDAITARWLADWGVDFLQGSLFGEAEPISLPRPGQRSAKRA